MLQVQTFADASAKFAAHKAAYEKRGAILPDVKSYIPEEFRHDFTLAMDAQPQMVTQPNNGIPAFLTTMIDPQVYEILFAPTAAADVLGEVKKGSWTDNTIMFPQAEGVGEVSSYGDYNNNGHSAINENWPQRQSYLFQIIEEFGDRQIDMAALGKIDLVGQTQRNSAMIMNQFQNLSYLYGVAGLQNYGLLNDPNLSTPLTPSAKAYGGVKWVSGGVIVATANEIYTDIQAMYSKLISQTIGLFNPRNVAVVLALGPTTALALTATNSFNVNVEDLLKKNFPQMKIVIVPQYDARSSTNPQGSLGGSLVQMVLQTLQGQDTGYAAFNEKMRAHNIVRDLSSWKQKKSGGTWGVVIRMPMSISQMLGV